MNAMKNELLSKCKELLDDLLYDLQQIRNSHPEIYIYYINRLMHLHNSKLRQHYEKTN